MAPGVSGSPNDGRGVDLAILIGIWTHSLLLSIALEGVTIERFMQSLPPAEAKEHIEGLQKA